MEMSMSNKLKYTKEVMSFLRGFFPHIYLGGSLGLEIILPQYKQDEDSDVDIFILTSRIESWALGYILDGLSRLHDARVIRENFVEYKLTGQWKRANLNYKNIKFDLICIDSDIDTLVQETGSSIGLMYHKLCYDDNKSFGLVRNSNISQATLYLKKHKKCVVERDRLTEQHYKKILRKCDKFDLEIIYR